MGVLGSAFARKLSSQQSGSRRGDILLDTVDPVTIGRLTNKTTIGRLTNKTTTGRLTNEASTGGLTNKALKTKSLTTTKPVRSTATCSHLKR